MAENKKKEVEVAEETEKKAENSKPVKVKKEGFFKKLIKLFKGSASEVKKVTWAGKLATTRNALLVIAVLIIFGVLLGLFDMGFNKLITFIIDLY